MDRNPLICNLTSKLLLYRILIIFPFLADFYYNEFVYSKDLDIVGILISFSNDYSMICTHESLGFYSPDFALCSMIIQVKEDDARQETHIFQFMVTSRNFYIHFSFVVRDPHSQLAQTRFLPLSFVQFGFPLERVRKVLSYSFHLLFVQLDSTRYPPQSFRTCLESGSRYYSRFSKCHKCLSVLHCHF